MVELVIPSIAIFVGMMIQGVKYINKTFIKVDINKFIPIMAVLFGIILGVASYFIPEIDMGANILEAIFMGAASGASAVCGHQTFKQLSSSSDDNNSFTFPIQSDSSPSSSFSIENVNEQPLEEYVEPEMEIETIEQPPEDSIDIPI